MLIDDGGIDDERVRKSESIQIGIERVTNQYAARV